MSNLSGLDYFLTSSLGTCQQAENIHDEKYGSQIINVLQDIMEIITQDVMINGHE